MTAYDLRIGNLVNYEQTTHVVVGIDSQLLHTRWLHSPATQDDSDLYSDYYENHKPIPLTAEILDRCVGVEKQKGLIIDSYSFDISKSGHDFKVISLTVQRGNQYIYIRQGERNKPREEDHLICIYNSDISGDIMVHDFQNLYRAITQTELKINL